MAQRGDGARADREPRRERAYGKGGGRQGRAAPAVGGREPAREARGRERSPLILSQDEAQKRADWLERAARSPCAGSFDQLLQGRDCGQQLKEQALEQIYDALGGEVAPEDLERALVVRNEKFHPATVCCLMVLTLGLFCFVRPRDDDAVLVLKRQGRVLLLKTERPDFFSGDLPRVLLRIFQYMLILLVMMSMPVLIGALVTAGPTVDDGDVEVVRIVKSIQQNMDKHLMAMLREKSAEVVTVYVLSILLLLFFMWSTCPHDYGTQYLQSHAAKSIVAGQFGFTGVSFRRRAYLRLYFGRFPDQAVADRSTGLTGGRVCGPVPREELVKAGDQLGRRRQGVGGSRQTSQGGILAFTAMVSVVTVMDSSFTWLDRYKGVEHLAKIEQFCMHTAEESGCTGEACTEWALDKGYSPRFCVGVLWYTDSAGSQIETDEARAKCLEHGLQPPCCGGCVTGEASQYLDNGMTAFRGILNTLADIGTLLMTFMAARWAMGQQSEAHHVDVVLARRPGWRFQASNLELTQPLAVHFLESVFRKAWEDAAEAAPRAGAALEGAVRGRGAEAPAAAPAAAPGPAPGAGAAAPAKRPLPQSHRGGEGVLNFEEDWTSPDWDDFFAQALLVERGADRWWPKVRVPRRCLGMLQGERVMATWVETPFITLVHILPNLALAAALFLLVFFMPQSASSGTSLIPGLGTSTGDRLASAAIVSVAFTALSVLVMWFCLFAAVQHVLVVTDLRLFYVRHRRPCWCLCTWGRELRVDVFRHDRDVFHAHMNSTALSWVQRLARVIWVPGVIFLQVKHGVLQLTRRNGNVLDIQNVVAQLTKSGRVIGKSEVEKAGVEWDWCQEWVADTMSRKGSNVWRLNAQPDDLLLQDPDIYLADDERPVFAWSFREIGPLTSPYTINTDIIVTTGRILLWSRTIYKRFDCKTGCCFLTCWCACCLGLCNARLPSSLSFLMLPSLLSFGTETCMEPPVWYDPNHMPVKMACFEECCGVLTRCARCEKGACSYDPENCDVCPVRSGPRAQLWMMWRLRQNMMLSQPDMECSIRPYLVPGIAEVDLASTLGLRREDAGVGELAQRDTARRVEVLRRIMGVAQDAAKVAGV